MRNPPSWLAIFVVISFNKISLFSEDLTILIMSFISLFARVVTETAISSLLNLSICLSRNFFPKFLPKSISFLATFDKIKYFQKQVYREELLLVIQS